MFSKISLIKPENPEICCKQIFLTFDIDWACDEILADTINLLEEFNASATWFVTHDTHLLKRLRKNPNFELGIHPNFNYLLNGDARNGETVEEVVDKMLAIVPEAKVIRSHSMTQNSNLLQLFFEKGLTHDCNHFIPEQSQIILNSWYLWNGLIKVPYFWEDDATCLYTKNSSIQELVCRKGLKVFDFHPIHIFLNTENIERYEKTRDIHYKPNELIKCRYEGLGTRTLLKTLLTLGI